MSKILVPKEDSWGKKKRRLTQAMASTKATERQWEMAQFAIDAWIRAFPIEWMEFQKDMARGRNTYNDAKEGGLKKSQFRNTAAFPVAYRYDELGIKQEEALLPVLKKIIPGLTDKKSKNFAAFLKRFPMFRPSEKTNAGSY